LKMIRSLKLRGSLPVQCRALSSNPLLVTTGRGGRSSTNAQTVTVFGATGDLGKFLINTLGAMGTQLIIPHRCEPHRALPLKVSSDLGQQHHVYMPDMNDVAELEQLVRYSDVVVNLTGAAEKELHRTMLASNVHLTHKIARACKNQNVPCFIHASHISAGDEKSPSEFIRMKGLSEKVVRHELPETSVIVRAADVFSMEDTFTRYISRRLTMRGRVKLYKHGLETFHHQVFAPDFMRGITKIIQAKDQDREPMYQFAGPERYSMNQTAEIIMGVPNFNTKSRPIRDFMTMKRLYMRQCNREQFFRYQVCSDHFTEGLPGLAELGLPPTNFEEKTVGWVKTHGEFWKPGDQDDGSGRDGTAMSRIKAR